MHVTSLLTWACVRGKRSARDDGDQALMLERTVKREYNIIYIPVYIYILQLEKSPTTDVIYIYTVTVT